jgi:hypothetical protein
MRLCTLLLRRAALAAPVLALPAGCQLVAGLRDIEEVDGAAGADAGRAEVSTDTTGESSRPDVTPEAGGADGRYAGGSAGSGGAGGGGGSAGSSGTGGSGGNGGAAGAGGAGGSGDTSNVDAGPFCACPAISGGAGLLYQGGAPVAGSCPTTFPIDGVSNSWFSYNDGTAGGSLTHVADVTGCNTPNSCAFHATGSGYTGYGAGVGFTLNNNGLFDASSFTGLNVYLRGTTAGTRGPGFVLSDNTVHVKLVSGMSAADASDPLNGDDYGFYCVIEQEAGAGCYTQFQIPFSSFAVDAYDAGVTSMPTIQAALRNLVKIQFEFSAYSVTAGSGAVSDPTPVSFDVEIDNVSFY